MSNHQELLDAIAAAAARPEGLQEVLDLTIAHFGAETGTIHMLGDDGALHLQGAGRGMPEQVLQIIRTIPVGKGMAGLAVERAEPVTACNLQTDDSGDVRPGAKATEMKGSIVVPVLQDGKPVGALGIAQRSERTFTEQETQLLLDVGSKIAQSSTA